LKKSLVYVLTYIFALVLILVAVVPYYRINLTLSGSVSNTYGRIGVRAAREGGGISKVYKVSPASDAGLVVGDVIVSCDGVKGIEKVDGDAGQFAHLTVEHKDGSVVILDIKRVPVEEIHD
jgi:C-terminal processing protease CtpA/Prc